jgi:hypothetical protein
VFKLLSSLVSLPGVPGPRGEGSTEGSTQNWQVVSLVVICDRNDVAENEAEVNENFDELQKKKRKRKRKKKKRKRIYIFN